MTEAYLAVAGHTNIDIQLRMEELPGRGQSSPVLERRTVHGGTAANVARHAAGLGVPVRLWSRVGDDFPSDWHDALASDGVDLHYLDLVRGGRTPTCYVLTDAGGDQAYCMDQGAMATMVENPPDSRLVAGLTGWLHLCTGDPRAYLDIAATARQRGIPVALDPGQELRFLYGPKVFERLLDRSDAVFLNEDELDLALRYLSYGDPVQLLDHVDTVVVTRGSKGASLYQVGGRHIHQDAFSVPVLDPTGAGDALRSGWYAALQVGLTQEEALRWGQAAAAIAVQHPGPQDHVVRPDALREVLAR